MFKYKEAMQSKPQIQASHLTKRYLKHGSPAIDDISLEVPSGSLFGIVGPDGAGKTTLLRILSTVLLPSSGSASLGGFDLRKDTEKIRNLIGYMPQDFSQYPDLSLRENLGFFANIQRVPKQAKEERIEKILDFTQLKPFENRKAGKLSGGMKKKLALGCAIIHSPRVLLLDEPSTGVDPVSRRELWSMLTNVIIDGVTVVLSTPYMDEAERCSEVAMLYGGKILTIGSPRDLTNELPYEVLEVKATPRKIMRKVVEETPGLLSWNPVGDRLRIAVATHADGERVLETLERDFKQASAEVRILRFAPRTMEDVFVRTVSEQREKHD